MMQRILVLLLCCFSTASAAAESLQGHFSKLNTWQADFVQTVSNKDTQTTSTSEGTLWLHRPNLFRLEYNKPYKQVYVADGKKLWFYDEDLEQISVKPQGDSLDQTPAMILSQPQQLAKAYTITSREKGRYTLYNLVPKAADTGFDHIEIVFDKDRLIEMHMFDHFAQRTSLLFKNIHENQAVPPQRFRFTPPPGVDVIGQQ